LHVPLALTSYYTPLVTNALWARLHPAVTRTGDTGDGQQELAIALRLTTLLAGTIIVSVLAVKTTLVRLAYSAAFVPAVSLLPAQLVGDLFYFIALACSVYLLAVSRLRHYLIGWTAYYVVVTLVSTALVGRLGVHAVPVGYAFTTVILGSAALAWFAWRSRGTSRAKTLSAIGGCCAAVVGQSLLAAWDRAPVIQFAIAAGMLAITARLFFSQRHELAGFRMLLGGAVPAEHA
jgi:O-antigen/teichoic acid export membrane protein